MVVDDVAPYWHFVLQHDWDKHSLSVGTCGIIANIFPEGMSTDQSTGTALDAQDQYIGDKHFFSAQTTWIHEKQDWNGSFVLGYTANPHTDGFNSFP